MAELSAYEKESYNIYIANDIPEETALKLATGELTAADYEKQLNKKEITNEDQAIEQAGYDLKLSDETKVDVANKIS